MIATIGDLSNSVPGKIVGQNIRAILFHILVSNRLRGSPDVGTSAFVSKYAYAMSIEPEIAQTVTSIVTMFFADERQAQCLGARSFRARVNASQHFVSFLAGIGAYARARIVAFGLRNTSATIVSPIAMLAVAFILVNPIVTRVTCQWMF